ncbi:MAG: TPM domain-containing protein [candidate division KSB1 bacterium]|nr:TPM domain-containing protein [candidate division KSB1 bacterium]MDZ7304126.1 TPM domain-containing protein [candidate division KSB1 bacterium]MDZ7314081.1 TPM domain-containing protein [candidate division KSB1 bacterium]
MASEKERALNVKIAIGLVGLWLSATTVFAQVFPEPRGYVNDFANVIPSNLASQMEAICQELQEKTGAELAVATFASIGDEDPDDYANRLFEKWGIGKKGKDNGVLLFLTLGERRRVRIETGYGIEGIIPDITAGRILDNYVVPELRRGDYGAGLLAGTKAIAGVIAEDAGVQITGAVRPNLRRETSRDDGFPLSWLILLLILILFVRPRWLWPLLYLLGSSGRSRHSDWGGFGGGFGGFGGGGFGGFGGGGSGGGGAGRSF